MDRTYLLSLTFQLNTYKFLDILPRFNV